MRPALPGLQSGFTDDTPRGGCIFSVLGPACLAASPLPVLDAVTRGWCPPVFSQSGRLYRTVTCGFGLCPTPRTQLNLPGLAEGRPRPRPAMSSC